MQLFVLFCVWVCGKIETYYVWAGNLGPLHESPIALRQFFYSLVSIDLQFQFQNLAMGLFGPVPFIWTVDVIHRWIDYLNLNICYVTFNSQKKCIFLKRISKYTYLWKKTKKKKTKKPLYLFCYYYVYIFFNLQ